MSTKSLERRLGALRLLVPAGGREVRPSLALELACCVSVRVGVRVSVGVSVGAGVRVGVGLSVIVLVPSRPPLPSALDF